MRELIRTIRVMIVDDEEHARNELQYLLNQYQDVKLVCVAANYRQALDSIQRCQPHLIFMDIQMPGMNGIKLVEKILAADISPLLVFATAHDEFAVKAFDLDAVDYLLKPFSQRRLDQCLNRVRSLLMNYAPIEFSYGSKGTTDNPVLNSWKRLAIENHGKAVILNINNIILACCSDGQLCIYTENKNYKCNMALQDLQAKLLSHNFFRSHRSYLVNLEKIKEVIPWFNGTYNLVMEGIPDMEVPVSRQQAAYLKKIFAL
ncbi:MAG: LytTR family DNA-binding domain-containing protein [Veillonellales bacterium]